MKRFGLFATIQLLATAAVMAQPMGMPKLISQSDGQITPEEEIIYDAPDGEMKYYNTYAEGWVFWGQEMGMFYMTGSGTNSMVWCDNGDVYIYNPVRNYATSTYARGTFADGKITVELPQCIGSYYDDYGEQQYMYLNKLEEVEQDGEKYYMICYPEDNYLEYTVDENGNVELALGNTGEYDVDNGVNPTYLVGITYENTPHSLQVWSGFGDTFQTWNYLDNGDPVTPPASAETDEWAFETNGTKSIIEVAIDRNDIYLKGFSSYIEEYWFKGTMDGDKIIFPSKQYMGMNEYEQFYYFMAARRYVPEGSDWYSYEPIDQVTLVYNPETGMYTAQEDETFIVSTNSEELAATAIAEVPSLWQQDPEKLNAAPLNPSVISFQSATQYTITWDIPNENVNGAILPTNDMYYNFYVDGELYTFQPADFPLFSEPTTDVPYDASNYYYLYVYRRQHTIYLPGLINETIGLQSFYVGDDGNTYASDLVTYNINGSVAEAAGDKEAVRTEYTTLSGVTTASPDKGFYIKKTLYSDGTSSVEKVIIR